MIKDEDDNDAFNVEGRIFSMGNKLTLSDIQGRERVYIEQQLFRFLPEYHIYLDGQYKAKVKKEFSLFSPRYFIEGVDGKYSIEGDFFAHEFSIIRSGKTIANISKRFFSFSDTYGVEIAPEEDDAFILSLTIVVDMVHHQK
jgi:uncharacterized protein YxjI